MKEIQVPRSLPVLILGLVAAALVAGACGDDAGDAAPDNGDRLLVVTTIAPVEALTREVGDGYADVRGIVPAGADAHDFEPLASDLRAVEAADLILRHGVGLDDWLDDTLGASDAPVVTVTEGIELQPPALQHDDDARDDELDPHVWHDPERAKQMVDNIAAALAGADPINAEAYRANAAAYKDTLDRTRDEVQSIIDEIPFENRRMVTNHDAFGYFADAFGLTIVGAVIPGATTEAEPSAGETAELLETIEREGVRAIFAESSVNSDLARTLAEDAGITIVDDLYGDALGEPGSGAETVHGMLLANARKIAGALR